MSKPVFVAGATGRAGQAYVRAFAAAGHEIRASVRPGNTFVVPQGVTATRVDFLDQSATRAALAGAGTLVIALAGRGDSPADQEAALTRTVATAAAEAGVGHIIYTSVHRADDATGVAHFTVKGHLEQELAKLAPTLTVLRPTTFADALTAPWLRHGIEQDGVLTSPISQHTPISYVPVADLARVAVAAVDEPDLQQAPITVAGPAATYADLLPLLSELAGRPVTYRQIPHADVARAFGPELAAMTDLFNREGFAAEPAAILHRLNLIPTPIEQWLRAAWAAPNTTARTARTARGQVS